MGFVDRQVKPAYAAVLHDLNGNVAGLSSAKESQARVDFSGKVNKHAPLIINGKVNPLHEDLFVDLQVDFRDLDLSHASPYTGTYVGYKTERVSSILICITLLRVGIWLAKTISFWTSLPWEKKWTVRTT